MYDIIEFFIWLFCPSEKKNHNSLPDFPSADMSKDINSEYIADFALVILVIIPIFILLLTLPFCWGENMVLTSSHCTIPVLGGFYKFACEYVDLLTALAGKVLIWPIILIAVLVSVISKVVRFRKARQKSPTIFPFKRTDK